MTPLKAAEGSPDIKSGVEINDDFTRLLDSKVEEANIKDKAEGGNLMTLEEKINEELGYTEEEINKFRIIKPSTSLITRFSDK